MSYKTCFIALITACLLPMSSIACSVYSINVYDNNESEVTNVIGARTLDIDFGIPTPMVKGLKGTKNTSFVNVGNISQSQTATWTNQYNYIGKVISSATEIGDGINDAGLYMGSLSLPGKTKYPTYDANDKRPALAVFDLINYVLATSDSVETAITNLNNVQMVGNALRIGNTYIAPSLHYFIKDKHGNGAVVEFVNGKTIIYDASSGFNNINVMTNSPTYEWQQNHYKQVSNDFVPQNTEYQTDGLFANGSGYIGLPGDFTPPSRFIKLKTLLQAMPKAKDLNEAEYIRQQGLSSAIVPIAMNPEPTLWYSQYNLQSGDYSITTLITAGGNNKFMVAKMKDNQTLHNVYTGLDKILLIAKINYPKNFANPSEVKYESGPQVGTPYTAKFLKNN